jgi:hypothetical protein
LRNSIDVNVSLQCARVASDAAKLQKLRHPPGATITGSSSLVHFDQWTEEVMAPMRLKAIQKRR